MVTASLKFIHVHCGERRSDGSSENRNIYMSMVSACAPTSKAPPGVKAKFENELQDALDRVPQDDILVVFGDFSGCVEGHSREAWGRKLQ